MIIHQKKFNPQVLHGKPKITSLFSSGAFIGKLEFGGVSHQKTFGSIVGSPTSTAAYLIVSSS